MRVEELSDKVDNVDNVYEEYLSKSNERMEIRFSHVMIEKGNYESNEEAFQQISLVEDELKKGASFEETVMNYSDDFVSKDAGGDLEYFDADIFPVEFGIALENMKLNEISNIIFFMTPFISAHLHEKTSTNYP